MPLGLTEGAVDVQGCSHAAHCWVEYNMFDHSCCIRVHMELGDG